LYAYGLVVRKYGFHRQGFNTYGVTSFVGAIGGGKLDASSFTVNSIMQNCLQINTWQTRAVSPDKLIEIGLQFILSS
jgi:hypothetical protein